MPASKPEPAALAALPDMIPLQTASRILSIGRNTAYKMIADGEYPVPVHRRGRRIVVSKHDVIALLHAQIGAS